MFIWIGKKIANWWIKRQLKKEMNAQLAKNLKADPKAVFNDARTIVEKSKKNIPDDFPIKPKKSYTVTKLAESRATPTRSVSKNYNDNDWSNSADDDLPKVVTNSISFSLYNSSSDNSCSSDYSSSSYDSGSSYSSCDSSSGSSSSCGGCD